MQGEATRGTPALGKLVLNGGRGTNFRFTGQRE